jgi:hypothetical protein
MRMTTSIEMLTLTALRTEKTTKREKEMM